MSKIIREMWNIEENFDFLQPAFFHRLVDKKFSKS